MSCPTISAFVKSALPFVFVFAAITAAAGCGGGTGVSNPPGTGGGIALGGIGGSFGVGGNSGLGGSSGVGGTSSGGSGGIAPTACAVGATEITSLPACSTSASMSAVDVPSGCAPTVDGKLHQEEWSDAACFTVGTGDMIVRVKYSGDSVYMATSGAPTCGCGMPFEFDPDGTGPANGNEFAISVFDDPFGDDGDRTDFVLQNGAFVQGTGPSGIVIMCPGKQPSPIRYEWKIPFAALGITAGSPHTYRQAIIHSSAYWPEGLVLSSGVALDPANWGQLSSRTNWK